MTTDYGDFDDRSNLDRSGVFRLNLGVSKEIFERHWVCVLNPGDDTFESLRPLIAEAYSTSRERADQVHRRRQ